METRRPPTDAVRLGIAFALIGALNSGCFLAGRENAPVDVVYGNPDSTKLEIGIQSCNQEPKAEVRETDTQVHLHVTVDKPGDSTEDCRDGVNVMLNQPLGDRDVIVNDKPISVTPAEKP